MSWELQAPWAAAFLNPVIIQARLSGIFVPHGHVLYSMPSSVQLLSNGSISGTFSKQKIDKIDT